jgi:hypothetical protein
MFLVDIPWLQKSFAKEVILSPLNYFWHFVKNMGSPYSIQLVNVYILPQTPHSFDYTKC